jgi:hypothetical protein
MLDTKYKSGEYHDWTEGDVFIGFLFDIVKFVFYQVIIQEILILEKTRMIML